MFEGYDFSGVGDWFGDLFGNSSSSYKMPFNADDWYSQVGASTPISTSPSFDWSDFNVSDMMTSGLFGGNSPNMAGTSDGGGSIWDTIKGGGGSVLGTMKANPLPTALGLGVGAQGISSILENRKAKDQNKALQNAASSYRGALQTGKDEATRQYVQNIGSSKAALTNKLAGATADAGGANPRRVMEKFNKQSNEGYGNFLLNLAQQKTPELSAFTTGAGGNTSNAEALFGGLAKGAAGTAGNIGSIYLANLLKGLFV